MIFGNPVRQAYIRPPGAPRISGNFRVTQDFGPSSVVQEPALTWPGGEGIAAGYYAHFHKGIDLGNGGCGADVIAPGAGMIVAAKLDIYGGRYVLINHGSGWGSMVGHLSSDVVSAGQKIAKAAKLGIMGNTGNSTGCHCHFALKSSVDWSKSFFSNTNGKWEDPWPQLAQNVTGRLKSDGINIRASAGAVGTKVSSTNPPIFATTEDDGTIRRKSDNASLGAFSQPRKWTGTVKGASYEVNGVAGDTWEKLDFDGVVGYVATPLVQLSAS